MKKYEDFIPKADGKFMLWTEGWQISFPGLAARTMPHVQQPEQEKHLNLARRTIHIIKEVDKAKSTLAAVVAEKERLKKEFTAEARAYINMAKASRHFTDDDFLGTGITCTNQTLDFSEMSPNIKAAAFPTHVEISFNKNHILSVAIYCRLPEDQGEWRLIAKSSKSPYIDKTPLRIDGQPERREYMAIFTNTETLLGQKSGIIQVTFG